MPDESSDLMFRLVTRRRLDKSMDKRKFAVGNYLLSVVAEGKTASILFKVE